MAVAARAASEAKKEICSLLKGSEVHISGLHYMTSSFDRVPNSRKTTTKDFQTHIQHPERKDGQRNLKSCLQCLDWMFLEIIRRIDKQFRPAIYF